MSGMKGVVRSAKNFAKGYSEIQAKLREATSNEPAGPSCSQLEELCQATFNPTAFADIIYIVDKRLNDHGKYWRHVYKTLVVLEYCICCGSEAVVNYARDTIYIIKTLKEFQFLDETGIDQGSNVREKSKEIVALLMDESMLAEARRQKTLPDGHHPTPFSPPTLATHRQKDGYPGTDYYQHQRNSGRNSSLTDLHGYDENVAMQIAIAESKLSAEEWEKKRQEYEEIPKYLLNERRSKSTDDISNVAPSSPIQSEPCPPPTKQVHVPKEVRQRITTDLLGLEGDDFTNAIGASSHGSCQNMFAEPVAHNSRSADAYQIDPAYQHQSSHNPFAQDSMSGYGTAMVDQVAESSPAFQQRAYSVPTAMLETDPFSDLLGGLPDTAAVPSTNSAAIQQRNYSDAGIAIESERSGSLPRSQASPQQPAYPIPMPLMPGQVPVSADLSVGAKPAAPFQMTPQFSNSRASSAHDWPQFTGQPSPNTNMPPKNGISITPDHLAMKTRTAEEDFDRERTSQPTNEFEPSPQMS